jgi:hypothetical protein
MSPRGQGTKGPPAFALDMSFPSEAYSQSVPPQPPSGLEESPCPGKPWLLHPGAQTSYQGWGLAMTRYAALSASEIVALPRRIAPRDFKENPSEGPKGPRRPGAISSLMLNQHPWQDEGKQVGDARTGRPCLHGLGGGVLPRKGALEGTE